MAGREQVSKRRPSPLALPEIADRIRLEHAQCEEAFRSGVLHALAAGKLLLEAKSQLGHGEWLTWLDSHCRFSARTAQGYMQLARRFVSLDPAKAQRVADLPYREALALIASPSEEREQLPGLESLSPEEQAELEAREEQIVQGGESLLLVGREALRVRELLKSPEAFRHWLENRFPSDGGFIKALLALVESGDPTPREAIALWGSIVDEQQGEA